MVPGIQKALITEFPQPFPFRVAGVHRGRAALGCTGSGGPGQCSRVWGRAVVRVLPSRQDQRAKRGGSCRSMESSYIFYTQDCFTNIHSPR